MPEDILSMLKVHDYFRGLNEEILADVAEQVEIVSLDTGECVHETNEPFTEVGFLARGRLKTVVVDEDGTETLFRFTHRGEQVGLVSAALSDPVPLRVIAVEPSTLIRLNYEVGLELTRKHPDLRRRWNENLAGSLRTAFLGDQPARKTNVLAVFHESPMSRDVVQRLIDRLSGLGEKPCLFSDHPDIRLPAGVPFRALREGDNFLSPEQVRNQLADWQDCNRVIFDVAADVSKDVATRLLESSEHVLWCTSAEDSPSAVEHLTTLESWAPAYLDKISLVWFLNDKHVAPALAEIHRLAAREFILTNVPARAHIGLTVTNGLERLIHFLRGVQVGLALGGGAARGMAHLGVLKMLEENGIVIDMIAGTSAGAMTGILYASGMDADYLAGQFTKDLKPSWFFRWLPHGGYWYLMHAYRRGRFDPMLRKYLEDWNLEQLPIPCSSVTVDLVSGKAMVRHSGDAVQAILESINLPVLSSPLCHDGQALIDGGFLNNVPADVLVSKGCNFVIAVDVLAKIEARVGNIKPDTPAKKAKLPSILETVLRTYTVLSHNMTAIGAGPADVVIQPDVSTFDMADFTRAVEAADVGKKTTHEQLPRLRKLLHRLDKALFPVERTDKV